MSENEKTIQVTCAIIEDKGRILAALRSESMSLPLKWEFPGGKVEPGERQEDSIVREIKEELDIEIAVRKGLRPHTHDYGNKIINLIPFVCTIVSGTIRLKEHKEVLWGIPGELKQLDWADADIPIFKDYIESI